MKKFTLLHKNKGFTLVECVIAIAVFAILTVMVLMIMGSAIDTSKKAGDAEQDLNSLVQNVVEDDAVKKYGADSHTLKMKFGSSDFAVTYSVVDGYRNYIQCPTDTCENHKVPVNSFEYMEVAPDTIDAYNAETDAEKKATYRICYWHDQNTKFKCPSCDAEFYVTLKCLSCNNTAASNNSSNAGFLYDRYTGNFYCNKCGSGNVKQEGLDDALANLDTELSVSGMTANAIRYGKIEQGDNDTVKTYMNLSGGSLDPNNYAVELKYTPSASSKKPGVYELKVKNLNGALATGDTAKFTLTLPGSYIVSKVGTSASCDGTGDHATVGIQQSEKLENPEKTSTLYVDGITLAGTGTEFTVKFTLTNYLNSSSFDYDYKSEGGLLKHWLKSNAGYGNAINMPRTDLPSAPATPSPTPSP